LRPSWQLCPISAHRQAKETHQASKRSKSGTERQRYRRATISNRRPSCSIGYAGAAKRITS
jgi:hypothetical protein